MANALRRSSWTPISAILTVLSVASLITCSTQEQNISNSLNLPERPVIEDLADIEALSYFVLAQKSQLAFRYDATATDANETAHVDERTFQDFLLRLKEGNVFVDRPADVGPLSCGLLQQEYLDMLKAKNVDISNPRFEEKLPFICQASTQCQSTESLMSLISGTNAAASSLQEPHLTLNEAIVRLCPVMLAQIHEKGCLANDEDKLVNHKPSPSAGK